MALGLRARFTLGAVVIGLFASGAWVGWHHLHFHIPIQDLLGYWYVFIAFLLLLAVPLAVGFHYWVLVPIELINSYAPPIERGELEAALIPAEDIPGDELGRMMLIRNHVVESILRMNAARKRELEFVRTVMDAMQDMVYIIDAKDFRIIDANRAMLESVGMTREQVLGRTCHDLLHSCPTPCTAPGHGCPALDLLGTGRPAVTEHAHAGKDGGERIVEVAAHPIREPGGGVVQAVLVAHDVTEQRRAMTLMHQQERLAAVGRVAAGVSHDFNNLLTAISGFTGLLLADAAPDDPRREDLLEIKRAGEKAANIVRQLLAFSRKQPLELRLINLNSVIADMREILRGGLTSKVSLDIRMSPVLVPVMGDETQLEQVLMNLAVNARDAMPAGGVLTVETDNTEFKTPVEREGFAIPAGSYALLRVRDTGCGMDAATLSHIFEPFFTTKDPDKGTGLGLAMVYGIVKQSRGFIEVDSSPGEGTEFRIYLPRAPEHPSAAS